MFNKNSIFCWIENWDHSLPLLTCLSSGWRADIISRLKIKNLCRKSHVLFFIYISISRLLLMRPWQSLCSLLLFWWLPLQISGSRRPDIYLIFLYISGGGDYALGLFQDNSFISNSWCHSRGNLAWQGFIFLLIDVYVSPQIYKLFGHLVSRKCDIWNHGSGVSA